MGQITITGGPADPSVGDGPVNSNVIILDFVTCHHCQNSIRYEFDMSSPFVNHRLKTIYTCTSCDGKPICMACGEAMQKTGKCPGSYRARARMGEFLPKKECEP
jgi:hypothetical protein